MPLMAAAQQPDHCTAVIDSHGLVVDCSDAVASLFGIAATGLIGHPLWDLITGMTPSHTSPSFNARYVAAISTDTAWRRFQAIDTHGRRFPVEISLSSTDALEQGNFLVTVRRAAGESICDRFKPI